MDDCTTEDELVSSAGDPMLRVSHSGRVEAANEAAADLWGMPAREMIGKDVADLVEEAGEPLTDRLRKPGGGAHRFFLPLPGGARREVRAWGALAPSAHDGLYVMLRAKGAAASSGQLDFEHFLDRAAHDLNEPLRKIYSFGQQLKRKASEKLDGECRDYLERMQAASERMHAMVEALLSVSRIGRGGVSLEDTDLDEVLSKVLEKHELQIQKRNARVDAGKLPRVRTDPVLFGQLLSNLVDNALKFAKHGECPTIRVRGERDSSGATIVVEDDGIGIESANIERIFRGFERLHGRRDSDGVGLGLTACRKIAKLLGGRIFAESEPGRGTRFVIALPP